MVHLQKIIYTLSFINTIWARCDPLSATTCSPDKALATSIIQDFTKKDSYFSMLNSGGVSYTDDGLSLTIKKKGDNPSLQSNFYIMFGKVEFVAKAANGTGIISTVYLQSDDLDEIDWEMFGGDPLEVESNYFSKGNTTTYNRGGYHKTSSSPIDNYHTYGLDWTENSLTWLIDDVPVRILNSDSPSGYPQSPMAIYIGAWAGGDSSNPQGTIEWAGGETDYKDGPFTMHLKSMVVTDYSSGSQYTYGNQTGDWTSIKSKGGEINDRYDEAQEEVASLENEESTIYTAASAYTPNQTYQTTTIAETTTTQNTNNQQTQDKTSTPLLSIIIKPTFAAITTGETTKDGTVETTTGYATMTTSNDETTQYYTETESTTTSAETNPIRSYFTTAVSYQTNPIRSYFTSITYNSNPVFSAFSTSTSTTYKNNAIKTQQSVSVYYISLIPLFFIGGLLI